MTKTETKPLETETGTPIVEEPQGTPLQEEPQTAPLETETGSPMTEEDIDNIDFSDITEDDIADLDDLENLGEIDDTMDKPHIKIKAKALGDFLKMASLFSCTSMSADNKAVYFTPEGQNLKLQVSNGDQQFTQILEIDNMENVLTKPFAVLTSTLVKLMKAVGSSIIIFENEEEASGYSIRLYGGGDFPVETAIVKPQSFDFSDDYSQIGTCDSAELLSLIKECFPQVSAGLETRDRLLFIKDNTATTKYLWSMTRAGISMPDMILQAKEMAMLRTYLTGKGSQVINISINSAKTKYNFSGNNFDIYFPVASGQEKAEMVEIYKQITQEETGVIVERAQLAKLIDLSAGLHYSATMVQFNIIKAKNLISTKLVDVSETLRQLIPVTEEPQVEPDTQTD